MFNELNTDAERREILDAFYESAQTHAEASDGLFVAYPPDPAKFEYHSLEPKEDNILVKGKPLRVKRTHGRRDTMALVESTDFLATIIDPRYEALPEITRQYDRDTRHLTHVGEVLQVGQNVLYGTDHAEFRDLAFAALNFSNRYRENHIRHRSAMIASKAIDFLGVRLEALGSADSVAQSVRNMGIEVEPDGTVKVRNFLARAVDRLYLTVPATDTFKPIRAKYPGVIKAFNDKSTGELSADMERRRILRHAPMLLVVAMPGTVNKRIDQQAYILGLEAGIPYDTYPEITKNDLLDHIEVIGRFSDKVSAFGGKALSFAASIRLEGVVPRIAIDPYHEYLNSPEALQRFGHRLVDLVQSLDPHMKTVQDNAVASAARLPLVRKATHAADTSDTPVE
jgi:hypothetical protein